MLAYSICIKDTVSSMQAYGEMANLLWTQTALLTCVEIMPEPPEGLDEDFCAPTKKLKGLSQGAAFSEQTEALLSSCNSVEEQVAIAYQ